MNKCQDKILIHCQQVVYQIVIYQVFNQMRMLQMFLLIKVQLKIVLVGLEHKL